MAAWGSLAPDALLPPPDNPATPPEWWNERVRNAARAFGSLVTLPRRAMQQGITTEEAVPWAADVGFGMVGAPGTPAGALGSSIKPIRAYHGSPHDFDRFDLSKIGTGEGAQAYGHGLYFAENEGVAKSYRDSLAPPNVLAGGIKINANSSGPERQAYFTLRGAGGNFDEAVKRSADAMNANEVKSVLGRWRDEGAAIETPGHMYEVGINAAPENLLNWDAPLTKETWGRLDPNVRNTIDEVMDQRGHTPIGDDPGIYTGKHLYQALKHYDVHEALPPVIGKSDWYKGNTTEKQHTSAYLDSVGIPGIKYLDQGSRGAGTGTNNYVVFDDKLIDILRKYGLTGMLGGAGAGGAAFGSLAPRDTSQ